MIDKLIRWRWALAIALIITSAALAPSARKALVPDNSLTVWFLETDPQLKTYYDYQAEYGNDEVILINIEQAAGLFTGEALGKLKHLALDLEKIDGVDKVLSLFTAQDAYDTQDGLVFDRALPEELPTDPAELKDLKERITGNKVFRDRMVSADGTQTMVWVQMAVMEDIDVRRDKIVSEVRETCERILGQPNYRIGGVGVNYAALNAAIQEDFNIFVGLSYVLMFLALWWFFRSWRLVIASMGIIAVSSTAALGIYGAAGHQINMVTSIIPSLVIILGLADAVHFPSAFVGVVDDDPSASRRAQVLTTIRHVWLPCLFTTVTTVIGFASLVSSPMSVLREMGIYSAVGLAVAFIASLVMMPVALLKIPEGTRLPKHPLVERLLDGSLSVISKRSGLTALVVIALVAVATAGALLVRSDTYSLRYLPDDHPVVLEHEQIVKNWGDYNVLDCLVLPKGGTKVDDVDIVNGVEAFARKAAELPEVRAGFSLADVYRRMADVLEVDKEQDAQWNAQELAQLSELLSFNDFTWNRSDPAFSQNLLAPFTNEDRSTGRLFLIAQMMSARDLSNLLERLDAIADETLGNAGEIKPAGYPPLYVKIIDYVTTSQISSFFIAIGVIFALMLVWLRSFRLALISLPSNLFPVLFMFGVMGFAEIRLDIATATIAPIVLGISIDDTIHFLHHWRDAERSGKSWSESIKHTYKWAGRPAVATAALLMVGFPVFMLAQVKTVFYFGFLATLAIGSGIVAELLILPLLLKWWPAKNITRC